MKLHQKSVEFHDPAIEQTHATPPYPLGPTTTSKGTNFSVFSASATRMELALFDHADDPRPSHVIALDPALRRTSHYWHMELSRGNFTGVAPIVPTIRRMGSVLTARSLYGVRS